MGPGASGGNIERHSPQFVLRRRRDTVLIGPGEGHLSTHAASQAWPGLSALALLASHRGPTNPLQSIPAWVQSRGPGPRANKSPESVSCQLTKFISISCPMRQNLYVSNIKNARILCLPTNGTFPTCLDTRKSECVVCKNLPWDTKPDEKSRALRALV